GPGDNLGVAMKLLVAGASQVVSLDRFYAHRNPQQQEQIYRELRGRLSEDEQQVFDSFVKLDGGVDIDAQRLRYIPGIEIESSVDVLAPGSFDFIVSRAVLEHVRDPDAAFAAMDQLLAPGGRMLHKIDFRDHGIFSDAGHHELTIYALPDAIHRLMANDSGKPNRRLSDYYRRKMAELGYRATLLVTRVVGADGGGIPP